MVTVNDRPEDPGSAAAFEQVLHEAMGALAEERPVFYNEADLQHSLAWRLHVLRPDAAIRLEVPLVDEDVDHRGRRLDLLVHLDGRRVAVELKYPRDRFEFRAPGEVVPYRRGSRDAADDTVYAIVADLARTERWVTAGAADVSMVLALTNIRMLWTAVEGTTALDVEFRIPEGAELSGVRTWGEGGRRKDPIELESRYRIAWRDFSDLPGATGANVFRYVVLRPFEDA